MAQITTSCVVVIRLEKRDAHLPRKSSLSKSLSYASNLISWSLLPLKTNWHRSKNKEECWYGMFHRLIHLHNTLENTEYLIHLVPCWVQVLLDNVTLEYSATYVNLNVGVALAFHHAPHQVILGHQVLSLQ